MAIAMRTRPLITAPVPLRTPQTSSGTKTNTRTTTRTTQASTRTTQASAPAPSPTTRPTTTTPTTTTALRELSEEDFWREVLRMARDGSNPQLAAEANRFLREQLEQGNEVVMRVLGVTTPTMTQQDAIVQRALRLIEQATRQPSVEDVVRSAMSSIRSLVPRINIPSFEEAQAQLMAAFNPIVEQARQQAQRAFADALRVLEGQQNIAGTAGSDVALRQLRSLMDRQAETISNIGERFAALAAEQAGNLIAQRLGVLQTTTDVQQRAVEMATRLLGELSRTQLAPLQSAGLMLDIAQLMESARQANLPYQFPTANVQFQELINLLLLALQGQQFQNVFGQF